MYRRSFLAAAASLACAAGLRAEAPKGWESKSIVEGNNQFAFDLYAKLGAKPGNVFASPFSISTALAMTSSGAKADTLKQMLATLHLPADPYSAFHDLLEKTKTPDPKAFQLVVANSLFGQKGYPWLPDFLGGCEKNFGAGLQQVDYAANTEAARTVINKWVESKTNDRIKDLMPAGSLNTLTRLVLVNAIYFKAAWKDPFDVGATKADKFFKAKDVETEVKLMTRKGRYPYFGNDAMQAVALPYNKADLSMLVLLPRKVDGLADLEKALTAAKVAEWRKALVPTNDVQLFLPKFKVEGAFDMGDTLAAMGMKDAFDPAKADLSGMAGQKDLFISKVIHKSFVEVDEAGTEAAAATGVAIGLRSMPAPPKNPPVVRCDHPFVFAIVDNRTDSILFLGRLAEPK